MARKEKAEGRKGDDVAKYAALVTLTVTWFTVIKMLFNGQWSWFVLHPTLESLAMFLITYGIMTLQPTSQPRTKAAGLSRHQGAILFLGLPALLTGTFAIIMNKIDAGKPHFISWHSTLGIIAAGWIVFQVCIGGASVWLNGKAFGGPNKAKSVWKWHRFSGYVLFPLLLITVNLGGALSNWGQKNVWLPIRLIAYGLAPLVSWVAILSRVRYHPLLLDLLCY
ncbi:hypothetical protein BDP27DRAFT_1381964 [Rhodocollybia butyracea]|uniref:Cytochrome b561 domain-containing protein n=1 Tax=Rhodocollybia butyracea TaxID=206335 RepID=A0A9P5Q167_9AGAR|nr:hypothetical protein BDP27DRAFT_1381964 [Rhodocollybia butyracea]